MRTRWRRRLLGLFSVYPWVDLENSGRDRRLWRGPLDVFDAFALAFIGAILLVLLARIDGLDPFVSDTYYHLAIAKQVNQQGAIPAWVDWDYAPVGRPHLYPPLIHLILAGLARVTGSLLWAGRLLAVVFLPASFLSCWYAARWILNSRAALVAALVLSLDTMHAVVELIYIPSCFVNILAPFLIITLLTRRTWASIILLTLLLYSHLGIPRLAVLGLVLFAVKYPLYRAEVLKVVGVAVLWASPWFVRELQHWDWIQGVFSNFGLPMQLWKRIFSLQSGNLVLIGCGLWGIRNLHRSRAQEAILRWMLVGMLPLLLSYGGRYSMHSAPLWAISASTVLVRLLPAWATWKRAAALTAATLLPSPALMPITTTHGMILLAIQGRPLMANDPEKGEAYLEDCEQAVAWLEEHTEPGEVVHVNKEWIGDLIPLLSDRRSDFGCWWECSREIGKVQNRYYRDSGRRAVFLCIRPESDSGSILGPTQVMPRVDEQTEIGRFHLGIRYERVFSLRQTLDDFQSDGPTAWRRGSDDTVSAVTVSEEPPGDRDGPPRRYLTWRIPAGSERETRAVRPVLLGRAGGLAMNVRASAPLRDVKLGLMEVDGSRYEWELSLPCVAEPLKLGEGAAKRPLRLSLRAPLYPDGPQYRWSFSVPWFSRPVEPTDDPMKRALWMRIRVPFDCMTLAEGQTDENERLDAKQVVWLWLDGPKGNLHDVRIDLDDIELMDVRVVEETEGAP